MQKIVVIGSDLLELFENITWNLGFCPQYKQNGFSTCLFVDEMVTCQIHFQSISVQEQIRQQGPSHQQTVILMLAFSVLTHNNNYS